MPPGLRFRLTEFAKRGFHAPPSGFCGRQMNFAGIRGTWQVITRRSDRSGVSVIASLGESGREK